MKSKILLLISLFFLSIGTALGQTITVKGVVLDENDEPMIGATVRVKGDGTNGALTNLDGEFKLPKAVQQGAIIIISNVGYKTQELPAAANMTVKMEPDAELLEDVVVVAYGTAKKESLVGAQSNISSKQLENRPITNVTNALAGAAPGVQSISALGQPGSSAKVMIRGFGSVNASSEPLYIVDGAVYNGSLADINPQDIASMSILKDAAATALYGSSAGNGVILITTKSGKRGEDKPSFTFTTNQGVSMRGQSYYETLGVNEWIHTRWLQWYNDEFYNNGRTSDQAAYWANYHLHENENLDIYNPFKGIKTGVVVASLDPLALGTSTNSADWEAPLYVGKDGQLNPEINGLKWGDDLNWNDALFRIGYRGEYNLNGSFSTDKVRSFMSVGHIMEEGYRFFTSYQRTSGRLSLDYNATNWLDLGGNISFVSALNTAPKRSSGAYSANSFDFVQSIAPHYPIHAHDPATGEMLKDDNGNPIYDYYRGRKYNEKYNPAYEAELDFSTTSRDMLTNRGNAIVTILPELKFTTNIAYDLVNEKNKIRYNNILGDQPDGRLYITDARSTTLTFNQLLEYSKEFGEHNLSVLLGHESYKYVYQYLSGGKKNMFILGLDEFSNFSEQSSLDSYTDNYRKEGYFSRVNWDYASKYNFSASFRRDGSSIFHPDYRWGNFWAVGAGWHIAREDFMKNASDWLNDLKLRLSYGHTGNDGLVNDGLRLYYAYQTTYGLGYNNETSTGLKLSNLADSKLRWEAQVNFDLAIEFRLFNRLRGSVEYFNKESSDLIFGKPIPISTTRAEINTNLGKVRNSGVEFDLNYDVITTPDFNWSLFVNGTHFTNKIIALPEANKENGIEQDYHKWVEGGSIYDYYLFDFVKVDPKDGVAIYKIDRDLYPEAVGLGKEGNEDADWTKDGKFAAKNFAGSSIPDLYGGFGTNLSWKNLNFNLLFSYQIGGKTLDTGYRGLMGRNIGGGQAIHVDMLNSWKKPGDVTDVPRLDAGAPGQYDNSLSQRFLISSSSLMLKSVSLGYTLPNEWFDNYGLSNARVSIAGENLFLLSKRKGLNPMGQFDGVVGAAGYAFARTVTASFSITF